MRKRRLALSVALLAGCAPQNTAVPPVGPSAPAASAPASIAPTASIAPGAGRTVRGTIYDEAGQPLVGEATVTVRSLNPSTPFETSVTATAGAYQVIGVPAGIQLLVTASRPGWTSRSRLVAVVTEQAIDFGSPTDVDAAPFYLSNYPEVASVEPGIEKPVAGVSAIQVTLSEPLDAANRARFAEALKLVPANEYAAPDMSRPRDIVSAEGVDLPFTAWPYVLEEDSTFDEAIETRASVSWDATGRVATLTLPAPLVTSNRGDAHYNVLLAAKANRPIVDAEGLPLGTNAEGKRGTQPGADDVVIENAFLKPTLSLSAADLTASAEKRWALLHVPAARFTLLEDDTKPRLQAVGAGVYEGDTRITLRFNKPLAAFDGTRQGRRDPGLTALPRYTFAIARSADELDSQPLTGEASVSLSGDTIDFDRRAEFELSPAADNPVEVELDPTEPTVLRLTVRDNPKLFATTVRAIKVRAEGVTDPAGNKLSEDEADANVVTGTVQPR